MRSNYKPLGPYIREIEERNTKLQDLPLMGLSVSKVLFPTIANLVGTDMSTYKLVYRNQFTYIADTSRRGYKIAIALNNRFDRMLVSQAYTPFEVTKPDELLPEYLMMWFCRPEFDRYARFMSHGSAREIFSWDEMCNTMLPIPSTAKQREIVAEYNIIQNSIKHNQQLIQKLERTSQTLYSEFMNRFHFEQTDTLSDYIESANTGLDAIKRAPIVAEDTGIKCLRIQDISKDACVENWGFTKVEKGNFRRFQLIKDDILVARTGATVGGNMFITKNLNAVFNNGLIRLRAEKSKVHPIILQALCKSDSFSEHIHSIAFGTSTQPNIQIGDLLSFQISFPSIDTQSAVIEHLITVNNLSVTLKEQINLLEKLARLLLSKLATVE